MGLSNFWKEHDGVSEFCSLNGERYLVCKAKELIGNQYIESSVIFRYKKDGKVLEYPGFKDPGEAKSFVRDSFLDFKEFNFYEVVKC